MGTLKALELSQIRKPEKIIAIGGFNSFCAPQDIERHRKMSVNLMLKGLSRNTKKVLDEFYTNARLSPREQTAHQDTDSLKKGLSYLRDTNYSEISDSTKLDIHLIEGIQDAIVPEATSRMLLEGPGQRHLHTLAGGHGVLENNIKEMSRLLREIL